MSGDFKDVIDGIPNIITKMAEESRREPLVLLIPNNACGVILGKKGQRIREIVSISGANIKILTDESVPGVNEKKLSIQADTEKQIVAVKMVLDYMNENPMYYTYDNISFLLY